MRAKTAFAAVAGLLGAGLAAAVMTSPNGQLLLFGTTQAAGGGSVRVSTGGYSMSGALGVPGSPSMTGGGFTLTPIPIQLTRAAQLDLTQAHAFPNPFKASLGHTTVTFTRLTAQARIRIYTVSGELVQTLERSDASTDSTVWDTLNSQGHRTASGLYLYAIDGGGDKKTGKLAIIR